MPEPLLLVKVMELKNELAFDLLVGAAVVVAGTLGFLALLALVNKKYHFARSVRALWSRFGIPSLLFVASLVTVLFFPQVKASYGWPDDHLFLPVAKSALLFTIALMLHLSIDFGKDLVYRHLDISQTDNLRQRRLRTQLGFVKRLIVIALWILTIGLILMNFQAFRRIGGSLLASAGLASVILGFAAQSSLSNFIAAFQIAFTQPIRLEDAVVIENEWGWVEEITFTYLVVRLWDRRRLIVPINYFQTHIVQNWTRKTAQIIGSVHLKLDFSVNLDELRLKFEKILHDSPLWDRDVTSMQVTETTEHFMDVRFLMTATNSPQAWDLRCHVREQLLRYLQAEQPTAFAYQRLGFLHPA